MKYCTALLLLISFSLTVAAADGINFEKSLTWSAIKAKAQKENKMIFFDAYTSWCGPCKYLETSIYTNKGVAAYYNTNFINAKFDMEKGEGLKLAQEFNIMAYPTLLFFSPEGKLIHKTVGAMEAPDFISLGKDARDPNKQYFTLQQKVMDKKASNEEFFRWKKMAEEMDDISRGPVAASWLSVQPDLLASVEMAKVAMLYAEVNEAQLINLYKEKKKIQQLLKWDAGQTANNLYQKLFNLAARSVDKKNQSTAGFSNLINKFEPARLNEALRELQLFTALKFDSDQEKAINLLITGLKSNQRPSLKETAILVYKYVQDFDEPTLSKLKTTLTAYKFIPADKGNECWLYLMQVVVDLRLQDYTNVQVLAEKAYKHPGLTQEYKDFLNGMFDFSRH